MNISDAAGIAMTDLPHGADNPSPSGLAATLTSDAFDAPHCQARLALGFTDDAGVTRLTERTHFGPLRVQKPLYPENAAICHAIIVHPPGGVVGGDELRIDVNTGAAAHALITTPGAAKWYKANGRLSRQHVALQLGVGARLEWLPQETIFFDAAQVELTHDVSLEKDACYIGSEILCFGRTAAGESFRSGKVTQRVHIRRAGRLLWWEQGVLAGNGALMHSPFGLAGHSVCATLVAAGNSLPATLPDAVRQEIATLGIDPRSFGISQTRSALVARYLGDASEAARTALLCVWRHVRPALMQHAAVTPRIWQT